MQLGMIGLGKMGGNMAARLREKGHEVVGYDVASDERDVDTLEALVGRLAAPRTVWVMVPAGDPTSATVAELGGLLEEGDLVIEGGNTHYVDDRTRAESLAARGIGYVDAGVSGGVWGRQNGYGIMVGGAASDIERARPVFDALTPDEGGGFVHAGGVGAGHFVKMVHNGIEYADMQLIAEAYDLLRHGLGADPSRIAAIFGEWNEGDLESYLIEITADVLAHTDAATGQPFIDVVLDQAEQKGTGRWTVQTALDLGVPVTGIAEATFARSVSGHAEQREPTRAAYPDAHVEAGWRPDDEDAFVEDVRRALYASKVVAYAQGFDEIQAGSRAYDWGIDPGAMATIWRGGCIIRARFLDRIREAYDADPDLPTLLVAPYFVEAVQEGLESWRRVVATAARGGIPAPAFASSLAYFDALRAERLPAALIQGLRDDFGAHTYRRVDRPGTFHTLWAGDLSEEKQG